MWAALALGTGAASSAAHPFSLEVNGVDVIGSVPMESVRVEMAGPGTNGSMSFAIADPSSALDVSTWDEVRFIEHAAPLRPILFGGFVQSVRHSLWATGGRTVEVECVGYGILLDKKVSPSALAVNAAEVPAMDLVSAVNRYGGILTALCEKPAYQDVLTDVDCEAGEDYGVANFYGWWRDPLAAPYAAGMTLRSMADAAVAGGYYSELTTYPTVGALVWADSARMVRLLPLLPDEVLAADPLLAYYQYDRGQYRFPVEVGGTVSSTLPASLPDYTVVGLSHEVEDSGRVSANYTAGGDAASSGWYRVSPPARAGDLEAYTSDGRVWDALPVLVGMAVVDPTEAQRVRGEATVTGTDALDVWPGRMLTVSAPQVGLSNADFRITGVTYTFGPNGWRSCSIRYGESASAPSLVDFYAARLA